MFHDGSSDVSPGSYSVVSVFPSGRVGSGGFGWTRARAEVQIKDLTAAERKLFDAAKEAELSCWLQTSALKPMLRKHLNPDQILRSRWVLTWKNVCNDDEQTNARKAKARLVVLGYQDPRLTEVNRDAPTLTREGRHTILQLIASQQWVLSSFDIRRPSYVERRTVKIHWQWNHQKNYESVCNCQMIRYVL